MTLIIHDLKEEDSENILKENSKKTILISNNGKIKPCAGCECCVIKTPGQCLIQDGYDNVGLLLSKCNQMIIISQCFYGGYSPFVKNVLDRTAGSYLLPTFIVKNGETHRLKRYSNNIKLYVHFYGNILEIEKETARKLVKANENNFCYASSVYFYNSSKDIKELNNEN